MLTWIRSYLGWARIWLGRIGPGPWRHDAYPFRRCHDCGKRMCLSAHYDCIPF